MIRDKEKSEAYDLMPEEIRASIPPLRGQETSDDPIVWVKLFTPRSNWTWFIFEFDGVDLMYLYAIDSQYPHDAEYEHEHESLLRMQALTSALQVHIGETIIPVATLPTIERDLHFSPKSISFALADHMGAE